MVLISDGNSEIYANASKIVNIICLRHLFRTTANLKLIEKTSYVITSLICSESPSNKSTIGSGVSELPKG